MRKKKFLILLFLLFTFLFWASRLWHFEKLLTFGSDQGTFFVETWEMVQEKRPRLIGLKVGTKEVLGRAFFTGPFFYYLLAILGTLFRWNPITITLIFLFFWWLTGLGIWYLVRKIYGEAAAVTAYGIFAVCPFLVYFSRIVWNSGFLPLVSVFFFFSLYKVLKTLTHLWWFLVGLFLGLALNISYAAFLLFFVFGAFFLWHFKSRKWSLKPLVFVFAGFILGELPLLLFEVRHNFYNLRTILFFLKHGVLEGRTKGAVTDYHFIFALLPLFFLLWGSVYNRIAKKFGLAKTLFLSLVLIIALTLSINWQQEWGTGMPDGWTLAKERKVAKLICEDIGNQAFEIAETINGDTRAHDLRFFLTFYGCPPLGVEDYPSADILYLVTTKKRQPKKETVWEVKSLRPFKISFKKDLKDNLFLYKLVREKSGKK